MKLGRPPTAPVLPIAMSGISARPRWQLSNKYYTDCRNAWKGAMSPPGTFVWTGRALQAGFDDLERIGLALLYPALAWSCIAPGHHGYPRAPDLILG